MFVRRMLYMASSGIFEDLAALAHPFPRHEDIHVDPPDMTDYVFNERCSEIEERRLRFIAELKKQCEHHGEEGAVNMDAEDALLLELVRAREEIREAHERLRLLLAYGREFQGRRPFPLSWLAEAAGMSGSGVRTAYGRSDVERVAELLEVPTPRESRPANTSE